MLDICKYKSSRVNLGSWGVKFWIVKLSIETKLKGSFYGSSYTKHFFHQITKMAATIYFWLADLKNFLLFWHLSEYAWNICCWMLSNKQSINLLWCQMQQWTIKIWQIAFHTFIFIKQTDRSRGIRKHFYKMSDLSYY